MRVSGGLKKYPKFDFDLLVVGIPKYEDLGTLNVLEAFRRYYPQYSFDLFHIPADFDRYFKAHFLIKRYRDGSVEILDPHVVPMSFWDRRKMFYPRAQFVYDKEVGWVIVETEDVIGF